MRVVKSFRRKTRYQVFGVISKVPEENWTETPIEYILNNC